MREVQAKQHSCAHRDADKKYSPKQKPQNKTRYATKLQNTKTMQEHTRLKNQHHKNPHPHLWPEESGGGGSVHTGGGHHDIDLDRRSIAETDASQEGGQVNQSGRQKSEITMGDKHKKYVAHLILGTEKIIISPILDYETRLTHCCENAR